MSYYLFVRSHLISAFRSLPERVKRTDGSQYFLKTETSEEEFKLAGKEQASI